MPDPTAALPWSLPGRFTREIVTGTWRARRPQYIEATAPCRVACPAGEPIAQWIERVRQGDLGGAWRLIREENPLPAVAGRVCGHPCESACNRVALDGAVTINALERAVGDWGLQHGGAGRSGPTRRERVAVVGAGPAGIACAYHLARLGYGVTVYDAEDRPGGLLRHGIPEYRLPRAVVEREIGLVLALGIDFRPGRRLGADLRWDELDAYDVVFLSTGAGRPLRLGVPGESSARVADAVQFLRAVALGVRPPLAGRVLVVGGGSTAMDAARTAVRLGAAAVTVVAVESRETMPALIDEVAQALAEGVSIVNGVGVAAVEHDPAGGVTGVRVADADLVTAADGAVQVRLRDGGRQALLADHVLRAIGQAAEVSAVPAPLAGAGLIAVDASGATASARVFAGGDVASRRRTVAEAIGAGTRAARAIHARLSGAAIPAWDGAHRWVEARPESTVTPERVRLDAFPRLPRATPEERPSAARRTDFTEVVGALGAVEVAHQAARCFTCGRCVACDVCFSVCPDIAIARAAEGYQVDLDHCKGCGLCATECPRGSLAMVRA